MPSAGAVQSDAVTATALLFVAAWAAAAAVLLRARPDEWRTLAPRVRTARRLWTLGLALHVVHVGCAFALAHAWSHAAAVRHVAATGGFGWGIAVNYLFAAAWAADAGWWWANPVGYATRPRSVGLAVHGFLAFVTFNATVVFGTNEVRATGAVAFAGLAVLWSRR